MTGHASSGIDRAQIQAFFMSPRSPKPDLRARIDELLRESIGLRIRCNEWFAPEACDQWEFAFNDENDNVPQDSGNLAFEARRVRWTYRIMVSHRGPLVTCETLSLEPKRSDLWHDTQWRYDQPSRVMAIEWTQRIARALDLHYVDATMLRDWQVSYDGVDPAFDLEHVVLAVPNAFQVLFYE